MRYRLVARRGHRASWDALLDAGLRLVRLKPTRREAQATRLYRPQARHPELGLVPVRIARRYQLLRMRHPKGWKQIWEQGRYPTPAKDRR